jgi:hypothetical protein
MAKDEKSSERKKQRVRQRERLMQKNEREKHMHAQTRKHTDLLDHLPEVTNCCSKRPLRTKEVRRPGQEVLHRQTDR